MVWNITFKTKWKQTASSKIVHTAQIMFMTTATPNANSYTHIHTAQGNWHLGKEDNFSCQRIALYSLVGVLLLLQQLCYLLMETRGVE